MLDVVKWQVASSAVLCFADRKLPSAILAEFRGLTCSRANTSTNLAQSTSCVRCVQHANDGLDPATATLWFAGKQLLPKNQLSHHLGRHEKTKAVIKLQQAGQGAPAREAVRYHNAAAHLACCFTTQLCILLAVLSRAALLT